MTYLRIVVFLLSFFLIFLAKLAEAQIYKGKSVDLGPEVGSKAPDFALPTLDGLKKITLTSFAGKKMVVLIFGSYT